MYDNIGNLIIVLGLISSLIAILQFVSMIINRKTLFYIMETKKIFFIDKDIENLSIKFKDQNIKSLYVTKMAFWTGKNIKVNGDELDENELPCFYCKQGKILSAEIIKNKEPPNFPKADISLENDDSLLIYFNTLDNDDNSIVLSVISTLLPCFKPNLPNIHKTQKIIPPLIKFEIFSLFWFATLGIVDEIIFLLNSSKFPSITFNSFDISFIYVIFLVFSIIFCYILCSVNILKIIDYLKIPKKIRKLFFESR